MLFLKNKILCTATHQIDHNDGLWVGQGRKREQIFFMSHISNTGMFDSSFPTVIMTLEFENHHILPVSKYYFHNLKTWQKHVFLFREIKQCNTPVKSPYEFTFLSFATHTIGIHLPFFCYILFTSTYCFKTTTHSFENKCCICHLQVISYFHLQWKCHLIAELKTCTLLCSCKLFILSHDCWQFQG